MRARRLLMVFAAAASLLALPAGLRADGEQATCTADGRSFTVTKQTPSVCVNGERLRFCSDGCLKTFAATPEKMILSMATCPIFTNKTPKADHAMRRVLNNNLYYLCCAFCYDEFGR